MKLTVKPIARAEVGEGVAVLDRDAMDEMGLEDEGYVRIEGSDGAQTVASVREDSSGESSRAVLRIDGDLRRAVGLGIDEHASVEPADVAAADRVTIALPEAVDTVMSAGLRVRDQLVGRAVTAGEVLRVTPGIGSPSSGSRGRLPVQVVETKPPGTVAVGEWTDVMVAEEPAEGLAAEHDARSDGTVTYDDVGGLDDELAAIRELVELPLRHPELFGRLGIEPPRGVLLHGPSGTGKTLITRAVAGEVDAHFETVSGPEITSKYRGESEERLRDIFERAEANAPAIVFIDEVDALAPRRTEGSGDDERRVVAQLLGLFDDLSGRERVAVIGTTNRIEAVDPALRRPGRFDREVEIGVPDGDGRREILGIHARGMPLAEDVDLDTYATNTHGFVGADLENLITESAMSALRRVRPEMETDAEELDAGALDSLSVTDDDLKEALRGIEPSALREVFVEVPDVSWEDVGGLETAKERLRETIEWPLAYPEAFERVDLTPTKGVLLHGPPGTGKTLLAKAVANEADSNFISIKGPELLDKYVGESERGVREVFSKARENAPTVIFFDEIDAIATERGNSADSGVGERVVSQLLTELDGLEALEDVVVVAATNRPDLIDDALVRPGRLDRHVHVSVPDEGARREIFSVHTRNKPLDADVDLPALAERTEGYVGADIEAVCREASLAAVREYVAATTEEVETATEDIVLTREQFDHALDGVAPSGEGGLRFE